MSKDEAITLVLLYSKDHRSGTRTKLNKLLAVLFEFLIPTELEMTIQKNGSHAADLKSLDNNPFVIMKNWAKYELEGISYDLTPEGKKLAEKVESEKLPKLVSKEEIELLQSEIYQKSTYAANQLSRQEHGELLIDQEDRHKLIQRINEVHIDYLDFYDESKKFDSNNLAQMKLAGLIEYLYGISKYFKEVKFKNIDAMGYDYDADSADYYCLKHLTKLVPFIRQQIENHAVLHEEIGVWFERFSAINSQKPYSINNPEFIKIFT